MKLHYEAVNQSGEAVAGVVDSPSQEEAMESLRQQGLFPTEIVSYADSPVRESKGGGRGQGPGTKLKNLANFARHLQILISSGTPLTESLAIVERQMEHPGWKEALARLRTKVEGGAPLSVAMGERPQYFDPVCRSLVAAGESSGELTAMLDRVATLTRRQVKLRSTVIGAMVYPALLCLVGISVLITLFVFVLPRFSDLFKSLDVPLPPTTSFLLHGGRWMASYWWAVLVCVTAGSFGFRWWAQSPNGSRNLQRCLLSIPKFGVLLKNLATARLARMLGVLLGSSIPLLESLQLVKAAAGNICYEELVSRAEDAVTRGEPMSTVFHGSNLVSPSVSEAIRNGEHTGKLSVLLMHVADYLDEENEIVLKALTSIIEPIILIVMGAFVGFIAISMFLPLFDLVGMAQGGGH